MNGKLTAALISLVMVLGIVFAAAQQPSGGPQHDKMMMENCHNNMQKMMAENTQAKKQIEEAKASNDPAKMRAALDQAEKSLDAMDSHMNKCMKMMGNMQGMHGMMMDQQKSPETAKPNEAPK
jgi:uncharacterized protein HemX